MSEIPDLSGVFFDFAHPQGNATGEIYEMLLVDEESALTCIQLLRDCVAAHGIFCSLYSETEQVISSLLPKPVVKSLRAISLKSAGTSQN